MAWNLFSFPPSVEKLEEQMQVFPLPAYSDLFISDQLQLTWFVSTQRFVSLWVGCSTLHGATRCTTRCNKVLRGQAAGNLISYSPCIFGSKSLVAIKGTNAFILEPGTPIDICSFYSSAVWAYDLSCVQQASYIHFWLWNVCEQTVPLIVHRLTNAPKQSTT